jgi:membrane-bound serine protease (ClpP class)
MAPVSHIGAAHPVTLGQKIEPALEKKILNDTVSFITSIGEKKNRNTEILKLMVTKSLSLTATEAKQKNLADIIANNIEDLKNKLENYKIEKEGKKIVLKLKNAVVENIKMNLIEKFLFSISHPNIAYILLILGIYGILAEFSTPGIGFPGVVGSICLILAFFSLNTLPINIAGLLLIVLSLILFVLEIYIQSGGILAIGGVVSFVLGSFMLLRTSTQFFNISPFVIISASLLTIIFFGIILFYGMKIQFAKAKTGSEGIIGCIGYAKTDIKPEGEVFVKGERWQAVSFKNQQINKNEKVEVVDIKNLKLVVRKVKL